MKLRWRRMALAGALLFGLAAGASVLAARASGWLAPGSQGGGPDARREIEPAGVESPAISFIDSPSASCYQPVASEDTCYITWSYLYVSAGTSQYVISMTISIDNRLRAYHAGFFQTSMYVPGDFFGRGFRVSCGPRGANGAGKTYAYTLRARETGGLSAANYGSVTCPGVEKVYLPVIKR